MKTKQELIEIHKELHTSLDKLSAYECECPDKTCNGRHSKNGKQEVLMEKDGGSGCLKCGHYCICKGKGL